MPVNNSKKEIQEAFKNVTVFLTNERDDMPDLYRVSGEGFSVDVNASSEEEAKEKAMESLVLRLVQGNPETQK